MPVWLEQLKKTYVSPDGATVPVIDVGSFRLDDGEQVALVGGSGTGKTTLLHLIAGILVPDRGRICFGSEPSPAPAGEEAAEGPGVIPYRTPPEPTAKMTAKMVDIATLTEGQRDQFRGRYIGYIFQTHHLLGGFTALENVLLGMSFTGRPADPKWARHLLEEVGLSDRLNYKPAKLSVGQQQRVAVARALANRPQLVLADEPTGALDPKTAQQVLQLIRRLCTEIGASLLLVTHDPAIVEQLPRAVSLAELNRASMV
jgi:putative ABC transport system ATP-binding protein